MFKTYPQIPLKTMVESQTDTLKMKQLLRAALCTVVTWVNTGLLLLYKHNLKSESEFGPFI